MSWSRIKMIHSFGTSNNRALTDEYNKICIENMYVKRIETFLTFISYVR